MGKTGVAKGSFYANMAVLSAVLVSESLSATLMMPFVGLFVSHLQEVPPSEAGYMSGLLISVFQLGQVLTGKMWGTASDRVGRKPMIQMGLFTNAIVSIFFGMSPNLIFCVIVRFIHGCANGNVLVAKTVIADITDKETEGMGFAAISIFWGVGSIIGPAIGGYLFDPVHHAVLGPWLFPSVTDESGNLFFDHPALLPCLVISVFSVITLIIISWVLHETSRHPVDPFLSLFTSLAFPVRHRHTADAKMSVNSIAAAVLTGGGPGATTGGGESVTVVKGIEENDLESDDDADSLYGDADALSRSHGMRVALSSPTGMRPQLTKRLFAVTNVFPTSESLNKETASARLAREYERGATAQVRTSETASHIAKNWCTSPQKLQYSSTWQCKFDEVEQPQRRAERTPGAYITTVERIPHGKDFDESKSTCSSLRLAVNAHSCSDDNDARSAPMVFGYREAFQMPSARNVMVLYMCIASTESALLEVIPLWAISEREKGGLSFASADIGTMLCISSVVYVLVNVAFSRVLKYMGGATRPLWDFSVLLWCITSILTPCCAYFTDEQTIFYSVSFITSVREIGLSWSYSILYMYVVRCAPDDCTGSINGIAQSIGSFSRMLTMLFIPPVFAWSLNGVTRPFPCNFHFVFWVTCVPLLLSFVTSSYLPVRVTG